MQPFAFNTQPSKPDYRDVKLKDVVKATPLPDKYFVDYSSIPVFNQKKLGICVACATTKRKELMEKERLSIRFMYALIKRDDGNTEEGTSIRNGLKILYKYGCCKEATVPTDVNQSHLSFIDLNTIPQNAYSEAQVYKDASYASVGFTVEDLKSGIYNGIGGIIARVEVGSEWWTKKDGTPSWNEYDVLPLRLPAKVISGHAIIIYGYEDRTDGFFGRGYTRFYFRNSWSDQWGRNGDGYFDSRDIMPTESWTSVDLPADLHQQVKNLPSADKFKHKFSTNMKYGDSSEEVAALQTALKITGDFTYSRITGYYGNETAKAVVKYQMRNGIISMLDYLSFWGFNSVVGARTRAKLNEQFS